MLVAFGLDYYTEVLELGYLLEHLSDDPFFKKYKKLNEALIGVVEDYSLVSFTPLCITVCVFYAVPVCVLVCAHVCVHACIWMHAKMHICVMLLTCHYYQDKETVLEVMKAVDKAGGYVYSAGEGTSSLASLLSVSVGADLDFFKYPNVVYDPKEIGGSEGGREKSRCCVHS